ncbi:pilus assembly protein [Chromobacterium sphagni]|uniref:Pilus assembly protein n=1 Tax=Chromobacterium sphagni TaxID=1903179 RepID=A0A1S1WWL7_9NEIS|nr:pilus assembly protein [Chromobacterium sphagni]OHX11592.1 pilus assembly protein [Chromobacterium sphagni]OHX20676.1 pilus assembly protein [Chromobacterium sphagni]
MKPILSACLLISLAAPVHAAPAINIGAMYEYLDADAGTLLKRVRNSGDSTAFVKVAVAEIVYGQDGQPNELPVGTEQLSLGQINGLIASPARLIVPAGGMQASRLLYLGPRDQERYFRVRFSPVLPDKQNAFDIGDAAARQYQDSLSAGVNVLTGYGAIVIVRPKTPHYDTQLQDGANSYTVRNNGNSTVILDAFYDCAAAGKTCDTPTKHHVLPHSSKSFIKVDGHGYKFELIEGSSRQAVAFGQ